MIPVAQIHPAGRLRAGVRCLQYAVGIDDGDFDDDVAQHIGRVDDSAEGGVPARLDAVAQIQQCLIDFAERTQHVLLEYHGEVPVPALGGPQAASGVFEIFEANDHPQHDDDHQAQND